MTSNNRSLYVLYDSTTRQYLRGTYYASISWGTFTVAKLFSSPLVIRATVIKAKREYAQLGRWRVGGGYFYSHLPPFPNTVFIREIPLIQNSMVDIVEIPV